MISTRRWDCYVAATVMALIQEHPNICSLVGVVTKGQPKLVLVSLCSRGSLLSVLQKNAETYTRHNSTADANAHDVNVKEAILQKRLAMARQIACGMEHLSETHFIIHRYV